MLDGLVVPIFQALYNLLHAIAGIFWWIDQALLAVGYYIMALTDWLVNTALAPLITSVSQQTVGLLVPIFLIAMTILGITYLLAVFGYIQIVAMRSAILWLVFAAFIYQIGPDVYRGTEQLRRGFGGLFYEQGIDALSNGATDMTALSLIGTSSEAQMQTPANQFAPWIASDTSVDGLDVAMAYLYADGCDVLRASGCIVIGPLPYRWYLPSQEPDYFNNDVSALSFPLMSNEDRQISLQAAADGIWRLASGTIVSFFGLIEQVIHLVLALAMGIAYVSLLIGVLFAFFKRTEAITWSIFNLVIELFIQSVITSLLLSIVISFVIIGSTTGNAVVLFGSCLIGLILAVVLLIGALKAMLNATNRLMGAMSQATGNNLGAAGQLTSFASAATGGGLALLGGATLAQSAGVAFSGTQAAQGAYFAASAFGRDSAVGNLASQVFEGASLGRVFSPVAAGLMLPHTSPNREQSKSAAMDEDGSPLPPYSGPSRYGALGTPIRHDANYEDSAVDQFEALYSLLSQQGRFTQLEIISPTLRPGLEENLPSASHAPSLDQDAGRGTDRNTGQAVNQAGFEHLGNSAQDALANLTALTQAPATPTSSISNADDLVAKVDAADDDDFARLSHSVSISNPDKQTSENSTKQQLSAERDHSPAASLSEFMRLASGLRIPHEQVGQVTQQVMDTGTIGPELSASLRSHLASLPRRAGGRMDEASITRAMRALERAAQNIAEAVQEPNQAESIELEVNAGIEAIVMSQSKSDGGKT